MPTTQGLGTVTARHDIVRGIARYRDGGAASLLRDGEVHVWTLRLDLDRAAQERLEAFLSGAEVERARRFVHQTDRRRYVCAHGLLRLVLSGYVGIRPRDIAFEEGPGGKPRLAEQPGPRFNLTHSDDLALVAVSRDREVGIDVERIREIGSLRALADACFSPAERAALAAIAGPLRLQAAFAGWTRKEAFLKALGEGLAMPLDSFDVTLVPGEPPRLLRVEDAPDAPGRYTLRAVQPAPGYVGALAVEGRATAVRSRPWEMLDALLEGGEERRARRRGKPEPGDGEAGRGRECA
ncbi:MAG TPA: 4'-phosphopantetheinyl transferase superfamily protein [Gemmatimonadales bacterium]|nr:4'-phosphopantetheinyl transferase superfamily protein [Gemmatimonadales bacterium]